MEYIRREWKVSAPGYFGWETNTGWCKNKIIIKKNPQFENVFMFHLDFVWKHSKSFCWQLNATLNLDFQK